MIDVVITILSITVLIEFTRKYIGHLTKDVFISWKLSIVLSIITFCSAIIVCLNNIFLFIKNTLLLNHVVKIILFFMVLSLTVAGWQYCKSTHNRKGQMSVLKFGFTLLLTMIISTIISNWEIIKQYLPL